MIDQIIKDRDYWINKFIQTYDKMINDNDPEEYVFTLNIILTHIQNNVICMREELK